MFDIPSHSTVTVSSPLQVYLSLGLLSRASSFELSPHFTTDGNVDIVENLNIRHDEQVCESLSATMCVSVGLESLSATLYVSIGLLPVSLSFFLYMCLSVFSLSVLFLLVHLSVRLLPV